jgi:hypothetical protein
MARIPLVSRGQIADREQSAYDAFTASRQGRPIVGPYSLLLHISVPADMGTVACDPPEEWSQRG